MSNRRAFGQAVVFGSLAGALPGFLITVPVALLTDFGEGGLSGLLLLISPIMIAAPMVLAGCLLIGLPFTFLLVRLRQERGRYYLLAGFLTGATPFTILMLMPDTGNLVGLLSVAGALGGAVSGWVWGRHRDQVIWAGTAADRG
jgi:hypothetical protein